MLSHTHRLVRTGLSQTRWCTERPGRGLWWRTGSWSSTLGSGCHWWSERCNTALPWSARSTGCFYLEKQVFTEESRREERWFSSEVLPLGLQALSSWASMTVTNRRPIPLLFRERADRDTGVTHTHTFPNTGCPYLGKPSLFSSSPSLWNVQTQLWFFGPTLSFNDSRIDFSLSPMVYRWEVQMLITDLSFKVSVLSV